MTLAQIITTFVGAMTFPLMIELAWGKLVDEFGTAGGFMAALFIVGTVWALNHHVGLIHQSGEWVDMGLAAGVGIFVSGSIKGGNVAKGLKVAGYAVIGAVIAGYVLSLL